MKQGLKPRGRAGKTEAAGNGSGAAEAEAPSLTLADLQPDERNPRVITEANRARLSRTMDEYGDLANITFNRRLGTLVGGHQRLDALKAKYGEKALRLSPVAGTKDYRLLVKTEKGTRAFPVRVVDWDEAKHRAALVAANSPDVIGEFDATMTARLFAEIGETDLQLLMLAQSTIDPILLGGFDLGDQESGVNGEDPLPSDTPDDVERDYLSFSVSLPAADHQVVTEALAWYSDRHGITRPEALVEILSKMDVKKRREVATKEKA